MQPEKRKFDPSSVSSISAIQGAGLSRQQNLSNMTDSVVKHHLMDFLNKGERTELMNTYRGEKKNAERKTVQDFVQKIQRGMDIRKHCEQVVQQWIDERNSLPAAVLVRLNSHDEHPAHGRFEQSNSHERRVGLVKDTLKWLLAHEWEIYDYQEPIAPKGHTWTADEIKHNKERKDALFHAQMIDGFFARLNPNTDLVWPKVYEKQPDVTFKGPELLEGGNWWLELFDDPYVGDEERNGELYTWRRLLLQGKLSIANLRRPSTEWPRYKYNEVIMKQPPVDYVKDIMSNTCRWARIDEAVDSGVIDLSAMRRPDADLNRCEMIHSLVDHLGHNAYARHDYVMNKLKSISHILKQLPDDIEAEFRKYEEDTHIKVPTGLKLTDDAIVELNRAWDTERRHALKVFWQVHVYNLIHRPEPDPSSSSSDAAMVDVAENQPGTKGWHIFPVDRRHVPASEMDRSDKDHTEPWALVDSDSRSAKPQFVFAKLGEVPKVGAPSSRYGKNGFKEIDHRAKANKKPKSIQKINRTSPTLSFTQYAKRMQAQREQEEEDAHEPAYTLPDMLSSSNINHVFDTAEKRINEYLTTNKPTTDWDAINARISKLQTQERKKVDVNSELNDLRQMNELMHQRSQPPQWQSAKLSIWPESISADNLKKNGNQLKYRFLRTAEKDIKGVEDVKQYGGVFTLHKDEDIEILSRTRGKLHTGNQHDLKDQAKAIDSYQETLLRIVGVSSIKDIDKASSSSSDLSFEQGKPAPSSSSSSSSVRSSTSNNSARVRHYPVYTSHPSQQSYPYSNDDAHHRSMYRSIDEETAMQQQERAKFEEHRYHQQAMREANDAEMQRQFEEQFEEQFEDHMTDDDDNEHHQSYGDQFLSR